MPDLGLQTHTERHFGFLVSQNGFKCTQSTPYQVRFESPTAFIELVFDGNRSFELGLLLGELRRDGSQSASFSIDEILRLRRAPEATKFSLIQVTSSENLASFVGQLAQLLRAYGGDFIAGDEQSFAELADQRRSEVKAYALKRDLRNARAAADAAWRAKDYPALVNALKPLSAFLTATEARKLDFAEKQSRHEGHS